MKVHRSALVFLFVSCGSNSKKNICNLSDNKMNKETQSINSGLTCLSV